MIEHNLPLIDERTNDNSVKNFLCERNETDKFFVNEYLHKHMNTCSVYSDDRISMAHAKACEKARMRYGNI